MKGKILTSIIVLLVTVGVANAEPNLVSWWKFDEGSGTTAYDSASDNDGAINGASWTTGLIDGALDFDGSNDYVDVADSASLSFTDPGLTIAAWLYLKQDQSGERAIVRKNNQWQLGIYPADNKIRNLVKTDGTTGWTAANDESYTIDTDTWYFFAFTYNGSVLKHYANGVQVGGDKTVTGDIVDNSKKVAIGSNTGGGSNNVNGIIDDVRIYNKALSASEILQLYKKVAGKAYNPKPNNGENRVDPNVILSWSPGVWATDVNGHDVYFGTDYNDVNDATTASAKYMGRQDANSYEPCGLELVNTYYWRIDEVNDTNPESPWKGDVWSFKTATPLIELSATQFRFGAFEGGANPNDLILTITNSGAGTLNWQIAEDCEWLSVEPDHGSSTGEADDANLSVDISGLTKGGYSCNLTISDANAENSPQIVDVDLFIYPYIEGVLYVPSEYPTIQSAIDAAVDGNVIIVEPGTYTGEGNRDIDFKGKAITVRSTDPNDPNTVAVTVIDCQGSSTYRHRGFKFSSSEGPNSVLSGLTITNGYGPYEEGYSTGGGIYCFLVSPTISNCIIKNNTADYGGGVEIDSSCPKVHNCSFVGNNAKENGGGLGCWYSGPKITHCTFMDNLVAGKGEGTKEGGGVFLLASNPTFDGCVFKNNTAIYSGGGIYGNWQCSLRFTNCIITGNILKGGKSLRSSGVYFNGSDVVIENTLISENAKGGIWCTFCNLTIVNCTITNDITSYGILQGFSYLDISNCIVWANKGERQEKDILNFGHTEISYSDVPKERTGGAGTFIWNEGNIDADPCFVKAGYWDVNDVWIEGDYHLLEGSPCIDTGDPNYIEGPNETDLDGNPRVVDGDNDGNSVIDMGAYEWMPPTPAELVAELLEEVGGLGLHSGIENSLMAKLNSALGALEDENENNNTAAINTLGAFINAVEAQRGKKIPEVEADALIAAAQQIIDLLSDG